MKSKTVRLDEYQMYLIIDSLREYIDVLKNTYDKNDYKYFIVKDLEKEMKKIIKKFNWRKNK